MTMCFKNIEFCISLSNGYIDNAWNLKKPPQTLSCFLIYHFFQTYNLYSAYIPLFSSSLDIQV